MAGPRQKCPNCGKVQDVGVYVSGQRKRCETCGIRFEVRRADAVVSAGPAAPASRVEGTEPTTVRPPSGPPVPAAPAPTKVLPPGSPPAPAARPLEIPGYELLGLIGQGGMGEVWKARQLSLGRMVALKVLAPELARDSEFVRRFEKESGALASLSHPNIVQIIDRGADAAANLFFFAMELCEGRSLRALMNAREIGLAARLDVLVQVCRAVAYAHGRGVIHRDLKPENILVDAAGKAKVVDFGLAGMRRRDADTNLTRAATAMGTFNYMAPEQRIDARSVDERADVYSLGVVLYELLTGDLPIGRFKLPSEKVPGVGTRLDKIVSKSLESDPDARYPSAEAMALELEAAAGSISSGGARGRRGERPGLLGSRGARRAALLALLLAALCGGVAFLTIAGFE